MVQFVQMLVNFSRVEFSWRRYLGFFCVYVLYKPWNWEVARRSRATTAENFTKKRDTQICYFANQNVPVPVVVVIA